jgi:hypothetical protein
VKAALDQLDLVSRRLHRDQVGVLESQLVHHFHRHDAVVTGYGGGIGLRTVVCASVVRMLVMRARPRGKYWSRRGLG